MIKDIKDLTQRELSILEKGPVEIIEMLDCMRFKIIFTNNDIVVKSAKGKVIDEIDCLVNIFNRNVVEFCYQTMGIKHEDIIRTFGECEITMMYLPPQKFNKISYDNYTGERFIYCGMYTKDKKLKDDDLFLDMCPFVAPYPCIDILQNVTSFEVSDLVKVPTFSGNSVDDIEGIILRCGNVKCKLTINDTNSDINPAVKKMYRDIVLEDFSKIIGSSIDTKDFFTDTDDYVSCICNMFYEYVNATDLFNKVYIESEDLLPPSHGSVGDVDIKYLPPTAKLFCNNKMYMNILRLLLVTFKTDDLSRFDTFDKHVRDNLYKVFYKINNL